MKALISILIIVAVIFVAYKVFQRWEQVQAEQSKKKAAETQVVDGASLPGVPPEMEMGLEQAYREGAVGLRRWLERAKRSGRVKDPRLAYIELDYVVMVAKEDPEEARRVFAEVQSRIGPDSPVYPRVQNLAKTYQ